MNAQTAKITPGKCEARFIWACGCGHQGGHWNVFMENGEQIPKLSEADAKFIAEAFNVYHETGLTPRQLADQRAELLGLLQELIDIEGPQPGTAEWANKVRAAIAKATGEQP